MPYPGVRGPIDLTLVDLGPTRGGPFRRNDALGTTIGDDWLLSETRKQITVRQLETCPTSCSRSPEDAGLILQLILP